MEHKDTKLMNIRMPRKDHQEIKIQATRRNITITQWVMEAIQERMRKEKLYE